MSVSEIRYQNMQKDFAVRTTRSATPTRKSKSLCNQVLTAVKEAVMSTSSIPDNSVIRPHCGFNFKARETLLGNDGPQYGIDKAEQILGRTMPPKSHSEFDLLRRGLSRKNSTNGSMDSKQSSSNSVNKEKIEKEKDLQFDSLDGARAPRKDRKMRLMDVGKTQSLADLHKGQLKTFQEENILKMPSLDSDIVINQSPELEEIVFRLGSLKPLFYSADVKPVEKKKKN